VLFHSLDGHFFSVEDTSGQGGFHISLFKHPTEAFDLSGTKGGKGILEDISIAGEEMSSAQIIPN